MRMGPLDGEPDLVRGARADDRIRRRGQAGDLGRIARVRTETIREHPAGPERAGERIEGGARQCRHG